MHTRYLGARSGNPQDVHDLGRWGSIDAVTLELRGGRDAPVRFSMHPSGALRLLDAQGLPIVSTLNYELARQADIDRLSGPIRLRGMYLYMADAASLAPLAAHAAPAVRHAVAQALGTRDDDAAIGLLLGLLQDDDHAVRNWATFALAGKVSGGAAS